MKPKVKKELVEWILILALIGIVYFNGWHSVVIGKVQQIVLSTGIITPSVTEVSRNASYEFSLEDIYGNKVSFSNFRDQPVFINFWATWCPPCIAEMPDIHELYLKQKSQVTFVMISVDKNERKALEYIEEKNFSFPVYFLRSSLPKVYDIHSIPTTYVLDKKGIIKVENHGMAKYNTDDFNALLDAISQQSL